MDEEKDGFIVVEGHVSHDDDGEISDVFIDEVRVLVPRSSSERVHTFGGNFQGPLSCRWVPLKDRSEDTLH